MTNETRIDGNSLLLTLVPVSIKGNLEARVENFSQARPSQIANSIRDIGFQRGKSGDGVVTVELSDPNAVVAEFVDVFAGDAHGFGESGLGEV